MKQFTKAMDAYQKAMELDPKNKEAKDGCSRCLHVSELQKKALFDKVEPDSGLKFIFSTCLLEFCTDYSNRKKTVEVVEKLLNITRHAPLADFLTNGVPLTMLISCYTWHVQYAVQVDVLYYTVKRKVDFDD